MRSRVRSLDQTLLRPVAHIPKIMTRPFVWLGRVTTPLFWMTALVTVEGLVLVPGRLSWETLWVVALIPLATIIKIFFRRQRPPTLYAQSMRIKSYSFPSSHAYSAALAGGFVAARLFEASFPAVGLLVGLLVVVIGVSRVYIGAHYPSDVLAGWLLGLGLLTMVLSFA